MPQTLQASQGLRLIAHFDLCTGCEICQLVCSERLCGGFNPRLAALRIEHKRENLVHEPILCEQCQNPFCQNVCPVQAIGPDEGTGARVIDPDTCIGCGLCAKYCPRQVIAYNKQTGKSVKCDLCNGDPLCVRACPTGALELIVQGGEHA